MAHDERGMLVRVQWAVSRSALPKELRHVTMVYALAADSASGVGLHSQATIAGLVGCSARQLRRYEADLEALAAKGESPVRIDRRHRGRPGGTGSTSDEWRVVLVEGVPERTPVSPPASSTGHACPPEPPPSDGPGPDTGDTRTGHPGHPDRTPMSDNLRSVGASIGEERSDAPVGASVPAPLVLEAQSEARPVASTPKAPKPRASNGKKPKPERSPAERAAFALVRDAYFAAVEQRTGARPSFDGGEGDAIWRLLGKVGGDATIAIARVRNAVLSDFGGSTSLRVIASDPNRFAELRQRDQRRNGAHTPPVQQTDPKSVAQQWAKGAQIQ